MENCEVLIECEDAGKRFCRDLKRSLWYGLRDSVSDMCAGFRSKNAADIQEATSLRSGEFWANRGITFDVQRGQCIGLIGGNGAGKTTLLKMLNGLIRPDTGRIRMRGRIGALIALGAGFNPVLTGRENVFVNGSILGLSKSEIQNKLEEIVDFADIEAAIDSPVRTYSSGMQVRLGFATAAVLFEPDILLLDEVLAVGDARFKYKCYRRIDDLRKHAAVIFVSHDLSSVARICNEVVVLHQGQIQFTGPPGPAIEQYNRFNAATSDSAAPIVQCFPPVETIHITDLPDRVSFTERIKGTLSVKSSSHIGMFTLTINIKDLSDQFIASSVVPSSVHGLEIQQGQNHFDLTLSCLPLKPGDYTVSVGIADSNGGLQALWSNGKRIEVEGGNSAGVAYCQPELIVTRQKLDKA